MHIHNELTYINKTSLALGFFDGIHQGHKTVLKTALQAAEINGAKTCVIMFKEHPLSILSRNKVEQILTTEEKLDMLASIGIEDAVILNFNDFQSMSAENYIQDVLIKYFKPIAITTGFNHTFGYKKRGNSDFLRKNSAKYGYKYYEVPPYTIKDNLVSSSTIRNQLQTGDLQSAKELLGYNYFIKGTVVHGEHIASSLGFPSANIIYPEDKIKVPHGVYYTIAEIDNKKYNGVLNYGINKNKKNDIKTEVHLLDFDNQNIYGQNIKISFVTKIRNQMNFDTEEKLKHQITRDIGFVEIYKYYMNDFKL